MTTPFYTKRVHLLPAYTHEYAATWYTDPCVIESYVFPAAANSYLRKDPTDPLYIEHFTNTITDEG